MCDVTRGWPSCSSSPTVLVTWAVSGRRVLCPGAQWGQGTRAAERGLRGSAPVLGVEGRERSPASWAYERLCGLAGRSSNTLFLSDVVLTHTVSAVFLAECEGFRTAATNLPCRKTPTTDSHQPQSRCCRPWAWVRWPFHVLPAPLPGPGPLWPVLVWGVGAAFALGCL